jgi:hypothetical protein
MKQKHITSSGEGLAELFEDVLKRGADLRVNVTGKSMAPFVKSGDTVTIRKVPVDRLAIGDLVFYKNRLGLPVLHRLIRIKKTGEGGTLFRTKGDALSVFDEPFAENVFIGKVFSIERASGCGNRMRGLDMASLKWRAINFIVAGLSGLGLRIYG